MTDLVAQLVGALEDCLDDSRSVLAEMERKYSTNYRQDWLDSQRKTIEAAEAALSAAQDGGWVAVPVEPTEEMVVAFAEEWYSHAQTIDDPQMTEAYAAMLAARPLPNPPKEQNT